MATATRQFKTNLSCGNCVAAIKPQLDIEPGIARWNVDLSSADKTLTVEGDASAESVKAAVARGGFQVLGELGNSSPAGVTPQPTLRR